MSIKRPAGAQNDATAPSDDPIADALASGELAGPPLPNDAELAGLPQNDKGNADRLLARFGQDLRFVKEYSKDDNQAWLAWSTNGLGGGWWEPGAWDRAYAFAHQTAAAIRNEEVKALRCQFRDDLDPDSESKDRAAARKKIADHARWGAQSGNQGRATSMLSAAKNYCLVRSNQLDAKPLALGLANGTLNLPAPLAEGDTGDDVAEAVLKPARREDLMTKVSPIAWDPNAEAPRFRQFLKRILPSEPERLFLQRWCGYCLTGLTTEQVICMFYGTGGNGKSTLLNIIKGVMGSYAIGLPFESFVAVERTGGQPTPDTARLPGVRLVTGSEPEVGVKLSEATIKAHTGGENIVVRPLYAHQFEFSSSHKIVLCFNQKPRIVGKDDGIWRRIALLHFNEKLEGPRLARPFDQMILEEEGAGVLRWMVDGYLLWREQGLALPDSVIEATAGYRAESNALADFLEACVVRSPEGRVQARPLYHLYQRWAVMNAVDPFSSTRFGLELPEHGFPKVTIDGRRYYKGLEIAPGIEDALARWEEQAQEGRAAGSL